MQRCKFTLLRGVVHISTSPINQVEADLIIAENGAYMEGSHAVFECHHEVLLLLRFILVILVLIILLLDLHQLATIQIWLGIAQLNQALDGGKVSFSHGREHGCLAVEVHNVGFSAEATLCPLGNQHFDDAARVFRLPLLRESSPHRFFSILYCLEQRSAPRVVRNLDGTIHINPVLQHRLQHFHVPLLNGVM